MGPSAPSPSRALATEAAVQLEATFLAEMLKSAGFGATRGAFGGGAGEDQFSSMLVREQALQITRAGGIGLTEILMQGLVADQDG
ncbi:rod-binding protein [Ruegeria sp. 2012CJ41-6]|uniref:Rod-binding protein n=1 Tax=Ruegeria spongiae TaxID=2942209 RepID=A0ABT0Q4D6_9RHOB|nr:rod-binding protein [Ruegeria spongiae]MCL6284675.1 rod-binding protein [Ruegeria spongiae]